MQKVYIDMSVKIMVPVFLRSERKDTWSRKFRKPRKIVKEQKAVSR